MSNKRIALITGASGGLGADICRYFENKGIHCIGLSRKLNNTFESVACDITKESEVEEAYRVIKEKHNKLDILINCAAHLLVKDDFSLTADDWNSVLQTNVTGTYLTCKYALKWMSEFNEGRIINISSVASKSFSQTASVAYTASKYAVNGITKQLADRVASKGISIMGLAPSQIETPALNNLVSAEKLEQVKSALPKKRLVCTEEISEILYSLVNSNTDYLNGSILDMNGGIC